ncbi:MAG: hypothetical protein NTV38_02495 [Chloroflexi bacterium]|nr:hypothetical protein [Chloroflexota bacterium]
MKKTRLFMFVAAVGLLGAQFAVPVNGQASPILAGASAATTGPHLSSEIVINAVDNEKYLPSVAYNSKHQEYLVVWSTKWTIGTRDIRAQRVSAQGKLLGSEFIVYENATKDSGQPSVAYDPVNDRYLVTFIFDAWGSGTDWDLYGRLIPWNGPSASLTAFPIITWGTSQWNPKVVYAGGIQKEFLVVWTNTYATGTPPAYISVKRIPTSGSGFSATADLSFFGSVPYVDPDVSYNLARNEYLVVWDKWTTTGHDIWGVRITGNAVPLGGGPFVIAGWPDNEMSPAVAACNVADQYLVTWQSDVGSGGTTYDIYGYFVTGAGALEPPPILIVHSSGADIAASVACNGSGSQYLVAYQQLYTSVRYGIWGIPISPDHSMEAGFAIVPAGSAADRTMPAIAGGRTSYLVVWEHQRDGTSYQDIHGRIVTPHVVFLPLVLRK